MNLYQATLLIGLVFFVMGTARRFPRFALSRPVSLGVSLVGLSLAGILAFIFLPVELMPNASYGVITITTPVRGGMSPTDIENLITKPIEEAVASVAHLKELYSNSKEGKSVVSIEFDPGTDMDFATLDIREKFARVKGNLPREVESPIIAHYRESDVPVLIFSLSSAKKSPEDLRALIDPSLKEKLLRVKGVANVDIAGGRERKIMIDVDRNQLAALGMDIRRVVEAIERTNINVKAGAVESDSKNVSIRALGQYLNVDDVGNTIVGVSKQGTVIRVKDLSTVSDSYLEQESYSRLNSQAAVTVYVQKESGANTVQVVRKSKKVLEAFQKGLSADIEIIEISNQAEAILEAIASVRTSLLIGMVLVIAVLGFFLGLKPSLVVALSIPLATLMTATIMYMEKLSVNVMTLSGLTLGIGLLVDNSIVVLEAIVKQLERQKKNDLRSVVLEASERVGPAIIGGTLTTIIVFAPFFLLSKQIQILYSGMAITITVALVSSLYIALTTIPYFTYYKKIGLFIENTAAKKSEILIEKFVSYYSRTLPRVFQNRARLFWPVLGSFILAVYVFQFHIDKNFSTGEEKNEFVIFVELPSGKRLDIADTIVKQVESLVRADEKIASSIHTITTRVEGWSGKVYVTLKPKNQRRFSTEEIIEELRPKLGSVGKEQEAFVYFSSPQEGQELIINVYGQDEKVVADYAMQVAGLFEKDSSFRDTKIRYRPGRPEVRVLVDSNRTALFGLTPTDVGNVLHAQTRGLRATYYRDRGNEVETIVRLRASQRESLDSIKTLLIPTSRGTQVPLAQMADFDYSLESSDIWRHNKMRMIQVSSNISKMSLEKAGEKAKKMMAELPFNTDYWAEIGGDYQDRLRAQQEFNQAIAMTALLIFAVLACMFESLLQPLLLFVSIPLTAVGFTLALFITRTPITMGAMIGILMTGGIAVNHAILLVDHFNTHRSDGMFDVAKLLIESGCERLRPILMTTATTILGLLPMAVDFSDGADLWRPMAITNIGGLLSSTILTLYVLPSLVLTVEEWRGKKSSISWTLHAKKLVKKISVLFLIFSFPISLFSTEWVSDFVRARVQELRQEGKIHEENKEYDKAVESYLEAVSLAPADEKSRMDLLRANKKQFAIQQKRFQKKRRKIVQDAEEIERSKLAWRSSIDGKLTEAENNVDKGQYARAYDQLLRTTEEAPTYLPALKSLDRLQQIVRKKLDSQHKVFSSDEQKKLTEGFWFYTQKSWLDSLKVWEPIIEDETQLKKFGRDVNLGAYVAKAKNAQATEERMAKINQISDSALASFKEGNLESAQKSFEEVLLIDPENAQAKQYTKMIPGLIENAKAEALSQVKTQQLNATLSDALEFYLKGYLDEAESKVKLVLAESPQHPQALNLANQIREARGVPVIPSLDEIKTAEQLKIEELYSDGIIAFAENRWDDARQAWQTVLQKNPSHTRAAQALQKLNQEQSK